MSVLNELFKDMAQLVNDQQETIDTVETNIDRFALLLGVLFFIFRWLPSICRLRYDTISKDSLILNLNFRSTVSCWLYSAAERTQAGIQHLEKAIEHQKACTIS